MKFMRTCTEDLQGSSNGQEDPIKALLMAEEEDKEDELKAAIP